MQYLAFEVFPLQFDLSFVREAFFLFPHTHVIHKQIFKRFCFVSILSTATNKQTITNNKQSIQKPPCHSTQLQADAEINRIENKTNRITNKQKIPSQFTSNNRYCVFNLNSPSNSRIKQQQQDKMDTFFQSISLLGFSLISFREQD